MKGTRLEKAGLYGALTLFGLLLILPFYYMVVTSLKSSQEVARPELSMIVEQPTMLAYDELLRGANVAGATLNSALIAVISTLGACLLCPLAGYAFAKHVFPGKNALFLGLLSTLMIPGSVLLVPNFLLFRDFGWLDTFAPLIIPGLAGAFGVFLSRQFIERIPDSLIEAAHLDGFSEPGIFGRIILPLSRPLVAALGILTFLGSWNSFVGPLLYLVDEDKFTLPLIIAMLQGRFPGGEHVQMAGAVVSIAPVLILFLFFQRQIVASLAFSGLKE
jgi:multiple sugar transport system permease protein